MNFESINVRVEISVKVVGMFLHKLKQHHDDKIDIRYNVRKFLVMM